jgi:hypothetical protein
MEAKAQAQIKTPLLEKKISFDDNNILVTDSISVLSPSDTPLTGKILFPHAKPEALLDIAESRLDKLENQVDLIKQTIDDIQPATVNNRFSEINRTISDMKHDISDMKQTISDMKQTISGLAQNIDTLSNQLGQLLSKLSPSQIVPAFDLASSAKQSETSPVS